MINENVLKAVRAIGRTGQGAKFCAKDVADFCDEKIYTIRRNLAKMEKKGMLHSDDNYWFGDTKFYSIISDVLL